MSDTNITTLVGRLTKDPELRRIPSGTAICSFSIAVNDWNPNTKEEYVNYFMVRVWDKKGENCAEYLSKGSQVLVVGKLKQERWESDGSKRSKILITATKVQFLDKKKEEETAPDPDLDGKDPF